MGAKKRFIQNPGNNAICYYRYSSDAQREVSIDQQKQAAHEYAEAHGYHIIEEYEDKAVSGTRDDREDYSRMLYEVDMLRPAYLILWKTDRLSRDRIDSVIAKKKLRDCGVKIVYVAEAIPEDDEATEILLESIYEGMAAAFISQHRKNVMRGLTYNAERALYNGVRVYGYKGEADQKYVVDPETAPIVKQIYDDYAAGIPMKKICDKLNDQGLKTNNGLEFSINSLRRILTNESYIGVYRWGEYTIPDGMPRIVEDNVFERVQARLRENQRGGKGAVKLVVDDANIADYWLSEHLHCGLCGSTMQGVSGTSKSGKKFRYYSCKNHRHHKCSMHNQQKELLEKIVLHILDEVVHNPETRLMIAYKCYAYYQSKYSDHGVYEASIKAQLRETETKIANLIKAIEAGVLTETTAESLKRHESTRSRLKDALIAEQNRQKFELKPEHIVKWLESFSGDLNDINNRKEILEDYIEKILVYEDKMIVTFKYTNKEQIFAYEETCAIINNQQKILEIFENKEYGGTVPKEMLDSVLDTEGEPSFF